MSILNRNPAHDTIRATHATNHAILYNFIYYILYFMTNYGQPEGDRQQTIVETTPPTNLLPTVNLGQLCDVNKSVLPYRAVVHAHKDVYNAIVNYHCPPYRIMGGATGGTEDRRHECYFTERCPWWREVKLTLAPTGRNQDCDQSCLNPIPHIRSINLLPDYTHLVNHFV